MNDVKGRQTTRAVILTDDLMIGIGTDASMSGMTRGGQAAVFDISDLTNLRRVATHGYGRNRQTMAGSDPRQFTPEQVWVLIRAIKVQSQILQMYLGGAISY